MDGGVKGGVICGAITEYLELFLGDSSQILFLLQKCGIDGIKLTSTLGVGENFVRFLDAFEKGVVVCILVRGETEEGAGLVCGFGGGGGFLVWVVF